MTTEEPLSPDDERRVSAMLRAEDTAPLPEQVTRRLDSRLEELVAERTGRTPVSSQVGSQVGSQIRARRRWPQALLAAAAVLVAGYAVGTSVLGSSGDSDSAGSAADSGEADRSGADAPAGGLEQAPKAPSGSSDSGSEDYSDAPSQADALRVSLRSRHLRTDVRRFLVAAGPAPTAAQRAEGGDRRGCRGPELGSRDTAWQVRLDGDRAVLLTRAAAGRVRATVYSCAGEPLVTTSVRAP